MVYINIVQSQEGRALAVPSAINYLSSCHEKVQFEAVLALDSSNTVFSIKWFLP
jgi:hypothetical protein